MTYDISNERVCVYLCACVSMRVCMCVYVCVYACVCDTVSLTVVRDDGPGHGRGVDLSDHPEHAQPAQVLPSLLPGEHLRKEGEHDGNGTPYPAGGGDEGRGFRGGQVDHWERAERQLT